MTVPSGTGGQSSLGFLEEALAELDSRSLLRRPPTEEAADRAGQVVLCSNDYLGLGSTPLGQPAVDTRGGAGASPLVVGVWPAQLRAQDAIAGWLGTETATFFTSGYAANVGAVSALVGPGDLVVSDRLNHASIIDGCRLSGATIRVYDHLDVAGAEAILDAEGRRFRRRLLVTESYFSMDADIPDLRRLRAIASLHDAVLYVDEAHAIGVFGAEGRGRCQEVGVVPDVLVGTLGKSLGLQGAFVAGSRPLGLWLWNRARSLVFSTALSPAVAAAVPSRVAMVRGANAARARLAHMASAVRSVLGEAGRHSEGPIVPWVLGEADRALRAATQLAARRVVVSAIRPPTVPEGTARLRIAVSAGLTDEELALGLRALSEVAAGA